ncbi:MAG: transcription antitermination factor NusB, partial [Vulcanimicrobiaceae bacterium]
MTARELALAVVRDVFPKAGKARGAHESFDYRAERSQLDARDRAFAAELAYGSIRARRYLDWLLAPHLGTRAQKLPPTIAEILRLGAYQLAKMSTEPHAAVSETVGLARRHGHRGTAGLVNAVLRRLSERAPADRVPQREQFESDDDFLGTLHSFPTWIVALARHVFGSDLLEELLRGMNAPAQASVRVNLLRTNVDEAIAQLRETGVSATPSHLVPEIVLLDRMPPVADASGRWEIQGEIAALPVDVLAPQADERGVELCSGRGNKTMQIAARMRDRGRIEAVEANSENTQRLRARLQQLGVHGVAIEEADATTTSGDVADFVLLDAPCSALGILGRQPEARWRKEPSDPQRLARVQAALLDAGATRVRPGGRMVYSVCSFALAETDERIDAFLGSHPEFARGDMPERFA